jgi:hypothetical protein
MREGMVGAIGMVGRIPSSDIGAHCFSKTRVGGVHVNLNEVPAGHVGGRHTMADKDKLVLRIDQGVVQCRKLTTMETAVGPAWALVGGGSALSGSWAIWRGSAVGVGVNAFTQCCWRSRATVRSVVGGVAWRWWRRLLIVVIVIVATGAVNARLIVTTIPVITIIKDGEFFRLRRVEWQIIVGRWVVIGVVDWIVDCFSPHVDKWFEGKVAIRRGLLIHAIV